MLNQSRKILSVIVAIAALTAACGVSREAAEAVEVGGDGSIGGDETSVPDSITIPEVEPPDLSAIPQVAATITFADGSTSEVPGEELRQILGQLIDSPEASTLLFGQAVTADFQRDTLSSLIQLRVLDNTISEVGGSVPDDAVEIEEALIAEQLLNAMGTQPDPIAAAATVNAGAKNYLDLIVAQRVRQAAITAAFFTDEEVTNPCSRHILVDTVEEADAIVARLADGEDFAELAMELSTGPSGPDGGDLGCSDPNGFVEPFANAILEGELNEILGPVETEFGFHVIEVYAEETAPANPDAAESEGFQEFSSILASTTVEVDESLGVWDPASGRVLASAAE
ncbi:MAG: hypothetical protein HKN03_05250 [Acidimicrobiales bacterium]|nr:hypothetical protein [Acidimicrobiales bacterium]